MGDSNSSSNGEHFSSQSPSFLIVSVAGVVLTLDNVTPAGGKEVCVSEHELFPMEKTDTNQVIC